MPTPDFSPDPPEHQISPYIRLQRVQIQPINAISTASKPTGVLLHYWHGRTIPHFTDTPCEPCQDGNTPRWKGYLTLYEPKTHHHWLQEYTPAAHDGIRSALETFGTLRGHLVRLERLRPSKNAPMRSEVYLSTLPENQLPPEPNIVDLLYKIWQLEPRTTIPRQCKDPDITHLEPTTPRTNSRKAKIP